MRVSKPFGMEPRVERRQLHVGWHLGRATIFATELLNLHIRRLLEADIHADLKDCFSANWVLNAYNEVTYSGRKVKVVPELQDTKRQFMPPFDPPDGDQGEIPSS